MKSQTCSFVDEVRTLHETKWLHIPQRCKYILTLSEKICSQAFVNLRKKTQLFCHGLISYSQSYSRCNRRFVSKQMFACWKFDPFLICFIVGKWGMIDIQICRCWQREGNSYFCSGIHSLKHLFRFIFTQHAKWPIRESEKFYLNHSSAWSMWKFTSTLSHRW